MNEWLRTGWASYAGQTLLESELVRRGLLLRDEVRTLIDLHRSGQRDQGQYLWNLFNLALWHTHWIERKSL
jgi:hypothetical protein